MNVRSNALERTKVRARTSRSCRLPLNSVVRQKLRVFDSTRVLWSM